MSTSEETPPTQGITSRTLAYLNEQWQASDKVLPYTLIAIAIVLVVGLMMVVPSTRSTEAPLLVKSPELLAERYVVAIAKVKGAAPAPSLEKVVAAYGIDGGTSCSEAITKLHADLIVRPKPVDGVRRPSYLNRVGVEQLRTTMRIYCPKRATRYSAWLKAQAA